MTQPSNPSLQGLCGMLMGYLAFESPSTLHGEFGEGFVCIFCHPSGPCHDDDVSEWSKAGLSFHADPPTMIGPPTTASCNYRGPAPTVNTSANYLWRRLGILRPWLNPVPLKTQICGYFENMDWHVFMNFWKLGRVSTPQFSRTASEPQHSEKEMANTSSIIYITYTAILTHPCIAI